MKKQKMSDAERFESLSEAEKARELAPFEQMEVSPGKPLTRQQRKRFEEVRRKALRGRPVIGKGAKIVPISIERDLLAQADAFARAHKIKRSQMVVKGLRLVMAQTKAG
jgi:hypothetical protein